MKKLLLILLLLVKTAFFGQISSLNSDCSGNTFNLNSKIPELLVNQNPNNSTVTFYLTFFDAVAMTNPIVNASAFVGTNGQEIYANVQNNVNGLSSQYGFSLVVTNSNLVVTTAIISPVTCTNGGTIQASPSGGSGNYTYTLLYYGMSSPSGLFSNLNAGNYTI
ncbi:MAG: hypothetical protein H7174_02625 [Flavobacterium sp.]|nr:hypothetical protein [Flavobacterium sp.]